MIDGGKDRDELFGMNGDDTPDPPARADDTIWGGDGTDVIHGGDETHNGEFKDIDKFYRGAASDLSTGQTVCAK